MNADAVNADGVGVGTALLRNAAYLKLFAAHVVALLGTGVMTVALGLLAYDLGGARAGVVLGTALALKMVAYVVVAPLAQALAHRVSHLQLLLSSNAIRAGIAAMLPLVDQVWQVYVLIFVLQSASAVFTPTFQALIPEVVPDEAGYTKAMTLSRLAYDGESLVSPLLAASLLTMLHRRDLFYVTAFAMVISTVLVVAARVSVGRVPSAAPFYQRLTAGVQVFLREPQLRVVLWLNATAATAVAFVVVNSVGVVRVDLHRNDTDFAIVLGAFGAGSMAVALAIPQLVKQFSDRLIMTCAGGGFATTLAVIGTVLGSRHGDWWLVLVLWCALGCCSAALLTPVSRVIRASVSPGMLPAAFAAQFSLSHACYLATYPLAGYLALLSNAVAALVMSGLAAAATVGAAMVGRSGRRMR